MKRENDMTLEDMYNARYNLDEDDDDSDWEPSEKQVEVPRWFCVNCTMVNVEDVSNCEVSCVSFWLFFLCSCSACPVSYWRHSIGCGLFLEYCLYRYAENTENLESSRVDFLLLHICL